MTNAGVLGSCIFSKWNKIHIARFDTLGFVPVLWESILRWLDVTC